MAKLVISDYNGDVSSDYSRKPGTLGVEPVGMVEIGERLGARRQTVAQWHFRRLLPEPRWTVSGHPAWNWPDVERWARDTGRLPEHKGSRTSGAGGRRGGSKR